MTFSEINPESAAGLGSTQEAIDLVKAQVATSPKTKPADPLTTELLEDRRSDRQLRQRYATWFMWILVSQLLVMNAVFILLGLGKLEYRNRWIVEVYIGATVAEVFGVVLVITRGLFPEPKA
ncbi:MAG: hypothetical protein ACFB5Z_02995 [Elainellaceae cyanobacterium]